MKKLTLLLFGLLLMLNINAQITDIESYRDSLMHKDYLSYIESFEVTRFSKPDNELKWKDEHRNSYKTERLFPDAPGSLLIKAKNQTFTGLSLFAIAGVSAFGAALSEDESGANVLSIVAIGATITGFVYEILGIVSIGKAGVMLNENGIGINIKF